ncbi:MAG: CoA pyrophosphatase [Candidatus Nitrosocosmicus sp.]|nr:CoA pyrophosphatase [Candidatus Nitrosocosmicus sp.]MDN5865885.1 CoA pyrophosphatase [Candidatus Nitrosocosmicus sp.]
MISEKEFIELVLEKSNTVVDFKNIDLRGGVNFDTQLSGVLVIIHFNHENSPTVIFTKRSSNLRNHAGEISFPGGRVSDQDLSIIETAIRETYEEIGLSIQKEEIIGSLAPTNTYTTKILIYPFIVILGKLSIPFEPNEEVEKVIEIPIEILRDRITIDEEHSSSDNQMFKLNVDDYLIWGATARILKNLLDLVYPL